MPVIHNYRRQYKDRNTRSNEQPHLSLSMGIHATHLRRQQQNCCTCQHLPKSFSQHSLLMRNSDDLLRLQKQSKSVDDVKNRFNQLQTDDSSDDGDCINGELSSESCCSITTDANCDFEFFQAKKPPMVRRPSDFRITRSNSRRSLENFQAYVDEATGKLDVKCRKKGKSVENLNESEQSVVGSVFYGGSAPDFRKIFISEYI